MKTKLIKLILALTITAAGTAQGTTQEVEVNQQEITQESEQQEVTTSNIIVTKGTYYDYLFVSANDTDYLLDDSEDSPYIVNGKAIFTNGEQVTITIETKGTDNTQDDIILDVVGIDE